MQPTMISRGRIILVGMSFFGDPFAASAGWTEGNEIGRLWARFMAFLDSQGERIKHAQNAGTAFEVHVEMPETPSKGHFEVFVGIEVAELEDVPVELLVKALPPAQYAMFTLQGEQIASDWSALIQEWMLSAGYVSAGSYGFQLYDQRFKSLDDLEHSELDVYVPVLRVDDV